MTGHAVTIGEALVQARCRAGLSVAQVSQKTRIREAIIRDIERDDYSACGADFYARGHIRAMARAVGTDAEALIQQYDAERSGATLLADDQFAAAERPNAEEEFGPDGFAAPEEFGAPGDFRPEEFGSGGPRTPDELRAEDTGAFVVPEVATGGFAAPDYLETGAFAPPPEGEFGGSGEVGAPGEGAAPEETTAPNRVITTSQMAAFDDIMASRPGPAPERTVPPRSRQARQAQPAAAGRTDGPDRIVVAAVVLTLAIFGGLAYLLVAGTRSAPQAGAAAAAGRRHQGGTNSPAASPRSSSPAATHPGAAVLTPARAVAFGPGGPAHGDNPQNASLAIDRNPGTAWQTDWYATSHFGNLKAGTGLLLATGRRVTITSAWITLGARPGADFQLRVGGRATLAGLRPVARAANAHGVIRLRLTRPAHVRYVLIWFTQLPPDPAGSHQVNVFNVRLRGNR
jgi:hypothetical protein